MISIIIPTHCRIKFLSTLLENLDNQTNKEFEVIVAHSGEDPETPQYINKHAQNYTFPITYIKCKTKGAASQRNEGVGHACFDWIFFLDDDMELQNNYLEEIITYIKKNGRKIGGVCGIIKNQTFTPISKGKKTLLKLLGVQDTHNLQGKIVGPCINFWPAQDGPEEEGIMAMPTGASIYNKEIFIKAGGFSPFFQDYSLAEDVYISLMVSKIKPLILIRTAIAYHNDNSKLGRKLMHEYATMEIKNKSFIIRSLNPSNAKSMIFKLYIWLVANRLFMLIKHPQHLKQHLHFFHGYSLQFIKEISS